jgi:hypothetical protein
MCRVVLLLALFGDDFGRNTPLLIPMGNAEAPHSFMLESLAILGLLDDNKHADFQNQSRVYFVSSRNFEGITAPSITTVDWEKHGADHRPAGKTAPSITTVD